MKRVLWVRRILTVALTVSLFLVTIPYEQATLAADKAPVYNVITINAAITPSIAEYVAQSIDEAVKNSAEGLIIRLDTPGGLDLAMRDIVKAILNAPLPVIVYVAPPGARAASAGAIITMAATIAVLTISSRMVSSSLSRLVPLTAETSTSRTSPPIDSTKTSCWSSSVRTRCGSAPGLSILLMATMIGTLAALA